MHADRTYREWFEHKTSFIRQHVGDQLDLTLQSIIVDEIECIYLFNNSDSKTAFATMELSEYKGTGPRNSIFENYELVMFSVNNYKYINQNESDCTLEQETEKLVAFLNVLANYARNSPTPIEQYDTCGFPAELETVGGSTLIFDCIGIKSDEPIPQEFGLIVPIEIHASEADFAARHGGKSLIDRLKSAGVYPYSYLDREAVV